MIFSMAKKSGSRCETKNIKKTREKYPKKHSYYISNISSSDLDSDSYLYSDSEWE